MIGEDLLIIAGQSLGQQKALFLLFGAMFFVVLVYLLILLARAPLHGAGRPLFLNSPHPSRNLIALLAIWAVLSIFLIRSLGTELSLIAVELALAISLSLLHPVFALAVFISLFILRPWEIYEGGAIPLLPRIASGICLASLGLDWVRSNKIKFVWSRAATLLVLFLFWVYLSTFGVPNWIELQADLFDSLFKAFIVFLLCQNIIRSEWTYWVVTGVIAISVIGLGTMALFNSLVFGASEAVETGRLVAVGMLSNSNDIAAVVILGFPFALGPLLSGSRRFLPVLVAMTAMGITAASVWFTRSRGAILALVLSFGLFVFLRSKRKWMVGISMLAVLITFPLVVKMLGRASDDLDQSTGSRVNYWITGVYMAAKNPVLGVGYNQFPKNYEMYAPNLLFEWGERTAHSSWVLALAETGVPGLVFLASLVMLTLKTAYANREARPEIFLACVGYFIAISFLSHTYLIFPYLLIGVALSPHGWQQTHGGSAT